MVDSIKALVNMISDNVHQSSRSSSKGYSSSISLSESSKSDNILKLNMKVFALVPFLYGITVTAQDDCSDRNACYSGMQPKNHVQTVAISDSNPS